MRDIPVMSCTSDAHPCEINSVLDENSGTTRFWSRSDWLKLVNALRASPRDLLDPANFSFAATTRESPKGHDLQGSEEELDPTGDKAKVLELLLGFSACRSAATDPIRLCARHRIAG